MLGTPKDTDTSLSIPYSDIPESWKWLLEIFDEAHLPKLGLPVTWETTQIQHSRIVINPRTNETINITTGKVTKHKKSPIGFIMSTRGHNPMPGAEGPAAVRYARYSEVKLQDAIVKDPHANELVPCIAHGDYVTVEALAADHIQAKEEIFRRQKTLVTQLNDKTTPEFADFLMKQEGMDKFFVKVGDEYFGTLLFYELYFNDIDNIWLICDACNLHKGNRDTIAWLKDQWLYGQEFLDYLGLVKDDAILAKIQDNQGLAQVAITWFWQRHANYISVAKKLFEDVTKPIQILNTKVDHVVGSGKQQRAKRLQASLDAKLLLIASVVQTKLGMPRPPTESPHGSSDNDERLTPPIDESSKPMYPTEDQFTRAAVSISKKIPVRIRTGFKEELQEVMQQEQIGKRTDQPNEDQEGKGNAKRPRVN